ncbi:MAG: right-handed parallel beta-helix repeat-containing protein [Promethearchaeota archaeon]
MKIQKYKFSNKNKKGLILLGIFAFITLFNNTLLLNNPINQYEKANTNLIKNLKSSADISHLIIDNNWSDVAAKFDWCYGSGFPWDPFILENLTIDGKDTYTSIEIKNSDDWFIIQNCTLFNTGLQPAISLNNVINARIENCTIYDSDEGISIYQSRNIEILDSLIEENEYGILIDNSKEIEIAYNDISNNHYGIQIGINGKRIAIYENYIGNNNNSGINIQGTEIKIENNTIEYNNGLSGKGIYMDAVSSILVEANNISHNRDGIDARSGSFNCLFKENLLINNTNRAIYLESSNNMGIYKNNFSELGDQATIFLENSDNNKMRENIISNSLDSGEGIYLSSSNFNTINDNLIMDINSTAISLVSSNDNKISKNHIENISTAIIVMSNSNDNEINGNTLLNSTKNLLHLSDSWSNDINSNLIENATINGILIEGNSNENTIYYNNIINNLELGIYFHGSTQNNEIYLNNFIYNYDDTNQVRNLGSGNVFNEATMLLGNYWANYTALDTDGDGVINTPYNSFGVVDNYPLNYTFEYYNFSQIIVDYSFDDSILGWNVTRFSNITAALNRLNKESWFSDAAKVTVKEGIYNETGLLLQRSDIEIIGESKKETIINGNNLGEIFTLIGGHITLNNLTLTGGNSEAIKILAGGNITIESCEIINNKIGIRINPPATSVQKINILFCNISNNTQNGIELDASNQDIINVKIENNNIANNSKDGILTTGSAGNVFGLEIRNNIIDDNDDGVDLGQNTPGVLAEGNQISNNKYQGYYVSSSTNSDGHVIRNNVFKGNGRATLGSGYGILLIAGTSGHQIYLNDFIDNNPKNANPILAQARDVSSTSSWSSPIGTFTDVGNYWHNWNNNTEPRFNYAIDINTPFGIYDNSYDYNGVNDQYPLVNRSEYYNFHDIYVDNDYDLNIPGWGCTRWNTIQEAIDAALPNGRVYIYNGTYNENVIVHKPLIIEGESRESVIVNAVVKGPVITVDADAVKITTLTVKNDSIGDSGIWVYKQNNVILQELNITENYDGISMLYSNHSQIIDCDIYNNNNTALKILFSNESLIANNTFFGNLETNNTINIHLEGNEFNYSGWIMIARNQNQAASHKVFDNTVNGNPLMYVVNQDYIYNEENLGQLILVNVNKSYLYQADFYNISIGVMSYYSEENTFMESEFTNIGAAIFLINSHNNSIEGNQIENCFDNAIKLINSCDNEIYGNTILYVKNFAIEIGNNSDSNEIYTNIIINNTAGISSYDNLYTNIHRNMFINSSEYAIIQQGDYGSMYHNNFIDNANNQSYDDGISNSWQLSAESEGNYWSNYNTRYPGATQAHGIWDTPYIIDGSGFQDKYPLVNPYPLGPLVKIQDPTDSEIFAFTEPTFEVEIYDEDFDIDKKWYMISGNNTKFFFTDNASIDLDWAWFEPDEEIELIFYANNSVGWIGTDNLTIYKDIKAPKLEILSPINNGNFSTYLDINIEVQVFETHTIDEIWYTCGGYKELLVNATMELMKSFIWNSLGEGINYIDFFTNDTSGNLNNTETIVFYKDTVNPSIKIITPEDGKYYSTSPTFDVRITDDNLDKMWYLVDGNTTKNFFTNNASLSASFATQWGTDDTRFISVDFYANDTAGNINNTVFISFYKDTIKPSLTILNPNNNSYHSSEPIFTYNIEDANAGIDKMWFTYDADGLKHFFTSSAEINAELDWSAYSTEDILNFHFFANDTAGNVNSTEYYRIFKDTIKPNIFIEPANNSLVWGATPGTQLNVTIFNSPGVEIWYRVGDAGANFTVSNHTNFDVNSDEWDSENDGTVIIYVWAEDLAGNLNVSRWYVTKTTGEPNIDIIYPAYGSVFNGTFSNFTVQFSPDAFPLHSFWVQNGTGGVLSPYWLISTNTDNVFNKTLNDQLRIWYNTWNDGDIKFIFYVNDSNHAVKQREWVIVKDTLIPTLTINSPVPGNYYASAPSYNLIFTDAHKDSLWYKVNDTSNPSRFIYSGGLGSATGLINTEDWNALGGTGTVTLYFYCNDSVGNEFSTSVIIEKDSEAPIINIISPVMDQICNATSPRFEAEFKDANIEYMWYKLGLLGNKRFIFANGSINQNDWDALGGFEDTKSIYFFCNDSAGNQGSASVKIIKDAIAPDTFQVDDPDYWPDGTSSFSTSIPFDITVGDGEPNGVGVDDIWITYTDGSTNISLLGGQTFKIASGSGSHSGNLPQFINLPEGYIRIYFFCNDSAGNFKAFSGYKLVLKDSLAPGISTLTLTNFTYYNEAPSFTISFTENAEVRYNMTGMGEFKYFGPLGPTFDITLDATIFGSLTDGLFNITLWYNDSLGNTGVIRFRLYKDTTAPEANFAGESPEGQKFSKDEAPIFYLNIIEANVSKIEYILSQRGYTSPPQNVPTLSLAISALRSSAVDWSNFPVEIDLLLWRGLDDGDVDIDIIIYDRVNQNKTISFTVIKYDPSASGDNGANGDDTSGDKLLLDPTTLIIIIVGAVAGIATVAFIATRKKKTAEPLTPEKKLQIKAPTPAKGRMVDGKVVGKKAKKVVRKAPEKRELTEEEKAEIAKAESEMEIKKEKHICVVHKGEIKGAIYLCPQCSTFYCMNCARTLKINGEKCWSCEAELEIEVPEELMKQLSPSSAQGILEALTKYDAAFNKAMLQDKAFIDVPQLDELDFSLINPDIVERLDALDIPIEAKTEILKDLMTLTPAEQDVLFEAMFTPPEDEEQG